MQQNALLDGVTDARAAIVSYVQSVFPEEEAAGDTTYWKIRMEYAELLLNLWGALAVDRDKQMMAAISAASTADLISKSQIEKLRRQVAAFEVGDSPPILQGLGIFQFLAIF